MPRKKKSVDTPPVHVLVTVAEKYHPELDEVVDKLRKAGLQVEEIFRLSGVVAGSVAHDDIAKLKAVEGVVAVENEPTYSAN